MYVNLCFGYSRKCHVKFLASNPIASVVATKFIYSLPLCCFAVLLVQL